MQIQEIKRLAIAIRSAKDKIAKELTGENDGGSYNFDACHIMVKLSPREQNLIESWGRIRMMEWNKGEWSIFNPIPAQGFINTRQAEMFYESITNAGFHASIHYQLD